MLCSAILLCLTATLYFWLKSNYAYWKNKGVPQTETNLFFGNYTDTVFMKKSIGQVYDDIYKKFSDCLYVGIYKMRTPIILVRDPGLLKNVLITNFNSFHDNENIVDEKIDPILAKNPFFMTGDQWKISRNQVLPCFSSGKLKQIYHIMQAVSKRFVDYIDEESQKAGDEGIDAKEMCTKYTTENVVNCAFGLEANCFVDQKPVFREMGRKMLDPSFLLGIKFMIANVFPSLSSYLKIRFISKEVTDYFKTLINDIVKHRSVNAMKRNDFLDILLEIKNKHKDFDSDDILAHSLSLFMDGTESSSIALSFILYELAANKDKQELLRREIDELIDKDNVGYENILALPYLEACINESLRLHPIALFVNRIVTQEYTLPPARDGYNSVVVKPGMVIAIPYYSLHMDAKNFPNPDKFEPERFLDERKDEIIKCTYLPFGEGPRTCLGQRFAITQIKVALFNIIANLEISVSDKTIQPIEINPHSFLMAAKGGLWLKYQRRIK